MTKIGERFTKPRKLVFKSLEHFKKPVTVKEIFQYLKRSIDLTSIYRTLELMKSSGVVNEIDFGDDKKRYELTNKNKHHHHLICKNCGDIEDIEMSESKLLDTIKHKSKFAISEHKLEFFGLCPNCQ